MPRRRVMLRWFAKIGLRYFPGYLEPLKNVFVKSNINMLFEVYVSKMIFLSILSGILGFLSIYFGLLYLNVPLIQSLITSIIISLILFSVVMIAHHAYPFHLISKAKKSLESNMPFGINHTAAVATSGVPPQTIFELISTIKEYGEFSTEYGRIVRNIKTFGMDVVTATKSVADRTPYPEFKQFLYGVVSNVETGGNIQKYFEDSSKDALFNYRIKREKYVKSLSTYADLYTAVLIAAPLFFISILSIMVYVSGQVFGIDILTAMNIGVFLIIPLLNFIFIMIIHYTQPAI